MLADDDDDDDKGLSNAIHFRLGHAMAAGNY